LKIATTGVQAGRHSTISFRDGTQQKAVIALDVDKSLLSFGISSVNDDHLVINSSGNVGIGTSFPAQKLHVDGRLRVEGAFHDSNNSAGTSGQILSSTVTGTDWIDLSPVASLTNHYVKTSLTSAYLTGGASAIDFDSTANNTLIGLSQDESVGSDITFASNAFTVSADGIYTVTINAEFQSLVTQRPCPTVSILINGSVVDGNSLAYVRRNSVVNEGTANLTRTLNLTAGDIISVRWSNQGATSTTATTTSQQFMVEVFKQSMTIAGALGNNGKFVDGTSSADAVYNAGNVGIGTSVPTQDLHVVGNARITGAIYDSNNSTGTSGQVLSSTATGTDWIDGTNIYDNDGTLSSNRTMAGAEKSLSINDTSFISLNAETVANTGKSTLALNSIGAAGAVLSNELSATPTTKASSYYNAGGTSFVKFNDLTNEHGLFISSSQAYLRSTNGTTTAQFTVANTYTEQDSQIRQSGTFVSALTATTHNLTNASIKVSSHIDFSLTGAQDITGIDSTDAVEGTILTFNVFAAALTLKHENGSSTNVNRFNLPGAADVVVPVGGGGTLRYNGTFNKWMLVGLAN
jgi:hypothetical protein